MEISIPGHWFSAEPLMGRRFIDSGSLRFVQSQINGQLTSVVGKIHAIKLALTGQSRCETINY